MKAGDRIQVKGRKDIQGMISAIEDGKIMIKLDIPINGMSQGFITKAEFDTLCEVIESSDWASMWDDASDD